MVKKLHYRRFVREILSTVLLRNTIYQTHPSYQTSGLKLRKKSIPYIYFGGESNPGIPTGRDPHHYTTEELDVLSLMDYVMGKHPISFENELCLP